MVATEQSRSSSAFTIVNKHPIRFCHFPGKIKSLQLQLILNIHRCQLKDHRASPAANNEYFGFFRFSDSYFGKKNNIPYRFTFSPCMFSLFSQKFLNTFLTHFQYFHNTIINNFIYTFLGLS